MWLCHVVGCEVLQCDAMWLCYVIHWEMMCCDLPRAYDIKTLEALRHLFHWRNTGPMSQHFDSVLQSTTLCYKVLQRTKHYSTNYSSVLQSTSMYYKVRPCTARLSSVLQSTTTYYTRSSVLQSIHAYCNTATCCKELLRTTEYYSVQRNITPYYKARQCTTKYSSVLLR